MRFSPETQILTVSIWKHLQIYICMLIGSFSASIYCFMQFYVFLSEVSINMNWCSGLKEHESQGKLVVTSSGRCSFHVYLSCIKSVLRYLDRCLLASWTAFIWEFFRRTSTSRPVHYIIDLVERMWPQMASNRSVTDFSAGVAAAADCLPTTTDSCFPGVCPFTCPFLPLSDGQTRPCGETAVFCCLWATGPEVDLRTLWSLFCLCFGLAVVKRTAY